MQVVDDVRAQNSMALGEDVPPTDQRAKRSYAFYTDQHGRNWGAVIENKTGDPCGPLEPEFRAPLRVHDSYITVNSRRRQLHIRYEDVIRDLKERKAEWDKELVDWARREYGQHAHKAIADPPPELLHLVGPPPPPSEPFEAALAGNRWVLGLTKVKPAWADEFFRDRETGEEITITVDASRFPDAEDEREEANVLNDFPKWCGPKKGWQIGEDEWLERLPGEEKDAYKARAIANVG